MRTYCDTAGTTLPLGAVCTVDRGVVYDGELAAMQFVSVLLLIGGIIALYLGRPARVWLAMMAGALAMAHFTVTRERLVALGG